LEGESGEGDALAKLAGTGRKGGFRASSSLQREGYDVGGYEDPVEELGVETRHGGIEVDNPLRADLC
jgi:hypothetical protein